MSETPALATRGNQLHQELLTLKLTATHHFYRLGEIMREVRDKKLWQVMDYESFEAYFSDPELDFERASVYRAIQTVEKFKLEEVAHVPVGKIFVILPYVTDENKPKLLQAAAGLSRGDLIHEVREGGGDEKVSSPYALPKIYRCKDCRKIKGVSFDGLCHCGWTPQQIEIVSKAIANVEENL